MVTHCALRLSGTPRHPIGPLCTNVAIAIASWLRVSRLTLEPLASQVYVCEGCLQELQKAAHLMRMEIEVRPLRVTEVTEEDA